MTGYTTLKHTEFAPRSTKRKISALLFLFHIFCLFILAGFVQAGHPLVIGKDQNNEPMLYIFATHTTYTVFQKAGPDWKKQSIGTITPATPITLAGGILQAGSSITLQNEITLEDDSTIDSKGFTIIPNIIPSKLNPKAFLAIEDSSVSKKGRVYIYGNEFNKIDFNIMANSGNISLFANKTLPINSATPILTMNQTLAMNGGTIYFTGNCVISGQLILLASTGSIITCTFISNNPCGEDTQPSCSYEGFTLTLAKPIVGNNHTLTVTSLNNKGGTLKIAGDNSSVEDLILTNSFGGYSMNLALAGPTLLNNMRASASVVTTNDYTLTIKNPS